MSERTRRRDATLLPRLGAKELIIKWPSGVQQRLTGIEADQRITAREPAG